MNQTIRQFNIRVYGILKNTEGQILLSDEYVLDRYMTKFPGGGLKFGEGPEDCIKREAIEEFGQEIEIIQHFYTTGFFQKALFYDDHQLISIYYLIRLKKEPGFKISSKHFDFKEKINGSQSFRWVHPDVQDESELSFPIDRYVLRLLKSK
jgi:ADP-ribose pyrophosphatase YjhB (NUDIX family)